MNSRIKNVLNKLEGVKLDLEEAEAELEAEFDDELDDDDLDVEMDEDDFDDELDEDINMEQPGGDGAGTWTPSGWSLSSIPSRLLHVNILIQSSLFKTFLILEFTLDSMLMS